MDGEDTIILVYRLCGYFRACDHINRLFSSHTAASRQINRHGLK